MYFSFTQFTLPNTSTGLILMQSWASLAHFIPLGILGPFYSFGIIGPFYSYIPMGFLLNLSGFLEPIIIFFTFGLCWPLHQTHLLIPFFRLLRPTFACFPFLIIPMGLLLSFLGFLGPVCFLCGIFSFYYFIGPWTIIPAIRV